MQLYSYKKSDAELVPCNYMERGEESGSLSNSFGEEEASLVAFCMGEAGQFTRHLCLALGAPYTYAALDEESATAPGQYTAAQMEHLLDPANYPFRTLDTGLLLGDAGVPGQAKAADAVDQAEVDRLGAGTQFARYLTERLIWALSPPKNLSRDWSIRE